MSVFRKRFPTEGGESLASIKDVARQAGVAISTVSKVLNGYEGVSESTKDKGKCGDRSVELYAQCGCSQHFPPNSLGGLPCC